jgi:hypothetical protein
MNIRDHYFQKIAKDESAHPVVRVILWEGEMVVYVHTSIGAHGFISVVIVVCRCDDPLEVRTYDGYKDPTLRPLKTSFEFRLSLAQKWTADQLEQLSTAEDGRISDFHFKIVEKDES